MNCWIRSTRGCLRNKNSPVDAGLFRTCAERPRDGRAISAARFPHIGCHTLPPPPIICETPRHAPPFPSYRCHFAHLRACFPRLSTHPQTAPLMLHYQRFSTLINPPQLSCHGSIATSGRMASSSTLSLRSTASMAAMPRSPHTDSRSTSCITRQSWINDSQGLLSRRAYWPNPHRASGSVLIIPRRMPPRWGLLRMMYWYS